MLATHTTVPMGMTVLMAADPAPEKVAVDLPLPAVVTVVVTGGLSIVFLKLPALRHQVVFP